MDFFTADPHYFHKNIIRYCDRPFQGIKDMHKALIRNYNKVVGPDDRVFFVGDFAMAGTNGVGQVRKILDKLNGTKVLILGNHDEIKPFGYVRAGFWSVHTSLEVHTEGYDVVMNHDPSVACLVPNEKIFICGHTHNLFKAIPEHRTVNVCVENWDYTPVTMEQIINALGE